MGICQQIKPQGVGVLSGFTPRSYIVENMGTWGRDLGGDLSVNFLPGGGDFVHFWITPFQNPHISPGWGWWGLHLTPALCSAVTSRPMSELCGV